MKKNNVVSRKKFRQLAPVEFDPKELLPAGANAQSVNHLLKAADVADNIFWQQMSSDYDPSSLLALASDDEELKEMLLFNYGPYDNLSNETPFMPAPPHFPGAGFYSRELTREKLISYLNSHPEFKASFESPYTIIRTDNSHLTAIPYHEAYQDQVKRLSDLLALASRAEPHPGFRRFLAQRAKDLLTDDYFKSESLWVGLTNNPIDLVIGPIEVYVDQLMGLKAAYEAIVLGHDFEESIKIQHFQNELPALCKSLEAEIGKSLEVEDSRVKLSIANLIYASGDARRAIPATAFNLPNDERVLEEIGSRQVILKNVLEAKFHFVMWPIFNHLLESSPISKETAFRNFFNHTLFHEIAHSIGPHRINQNGELTTVNRALQQYYSVLEEAKADTLAACLMLKISSGSGSQAFLETYISGFLRSIRFGLANAHGGSNAIQFNFLVKEGAMTVDNEAVGIVINYPRAHKAILKLATEIISIEERGDFEKAKRFVSKYCTTYNDLNSLVHKVRDFPIDIRISYKSPL